ncbi:MAG TPA: Crp/Fnr family transcriptional regulator [Allosphingosinicella sp.]|nr:Crp/Fnr family transcriptional regulator [Allosphingosinicella sp.]
MIDVHLRKLRARDEISDEEERAIRGAVAEIRDVPACATIVRAGEELSVSTLLLSGLLGRYKDLRGGQRQITELHVPGDFADLHSFTLKRLDHNVMALTDCRIAIVPHERLTQITREHPHLTRLFWFLTNLDAAIHREWVLSLGRRSAPARTAHLFCELRLRLGIVGLADETGFALGLTQIELAECVGLTAVHVNRTLRRLRELGLARFRSRRVTILDLPGLERLAEFDPAYLYLERRTR